MNGNAPQQVPPLRTILHLAVGDSHQPSRELAWGTRVAPFSVGVRGDWSVDALGVADVHLFFAFDGRQLHVAAAPGSGQTVVGGVPIPQGWSPVSANSEIRFGQACILVRCDQGAAAGAGGGAPGSQWPPGVPQGPLVDPTPPKASRPKRTVRLSELEGTQPAVGQIPTGASPLGYRSSPPMGNVAPPAVGAMEHQPQARPAVMLPILFRSGEHPDARDFAAVLGSASGTSPGLSGVSGGGGAGLLGAGTSEPPWMEAGPHTVSDGGALRAFTDGTPGWMRPVSDVPPREANASGAAAPRGRPPDAGAFPQGFSRPEPSVSGLGVLPLNPGGALGVPPARTGQVSPQTASQGKEPKGIQAIWRHASLPIRISLGLLPVALTLMLVLAVSGGLQPVVRGSEPTIATGNSNAVNAQSATAATTVGVGASQPTAASPATVGTPLSTAAPAAVAVGPSQSTAAPATVAVGPSVPAAEPVAALSSPMGSPSALASGAAPEVSGGRQAGQARVAATSGGGRVRAAQPALGLNPPPAGSAGSGLPPGAERAALDAAFGGRLEEAALRYEGLSKQPNGAVYALAARLARERAVRKP